MVLKTLQAWRCRVKSSYTDLRLPVIQDRDDGHFTSFRVQTKSSKTECQQAPDNARRLYHIDVSYIIPVSQADVALDTRIPWLLLRRISSRPAAFNAPHFLFGGYWFFLPVHCKYTDDVLCFKTATCSSGLRGPRSFAGKWPV